MSREKPTESHDKNAGGLRQDRAEFVRRILITVLIVVTITLLLILFWYTIYVLILLFAGTLLAVFLRGMSNWVRERTGLPDQAALAIVITALFVAAGLVIWLLTPRVVSQAEELIGRIPNALRLLQDLLQQNEVTGRILNRIPQAEEIVRSTGGLLGRAAGVFSTTLGAATGLIAVLFIGLYLAFDPRTYTEGFVRLVPPVRRERAREVIREAADTLHWWLLGRLLDMAVVAVLTMVGLWLLGVKLALTLGLLAGVLTFVPYLGPVVSAIPAILVGMLDSMELGLYVGLLYLGIQSAESYLLTPNIQKRTVSMPPVLLLSAQILMGILLGVLGVMLATPLMALFIALTKMLYVEDVLGEKVEKEEPEESGASAE